MYQTNHYKYRNKGYLPGHFCTECECDDNTDDPKELTDIHFKKHGEV